MVWWYISIIKRFEYKCVENVNLNESNIIVEILISKFSVLMVFFFNVYWWLLFILYHLPLTFIRVVMTETRKINLRKYFFLTCKHKKFRNISVSSKVFESKRVYDLWETISQKLTFYKSFSIKNHKTYVT